MARKISRRKRQSIVLKYHRLMGRTKNNLKPRNELQAVQNKLISKNGPSVTKSQIVEGKKIGRKLINKIPNLKSNLQSIWNTSNNLDDFINKSIDVVGMSNLINDEEDQINFGGLTWGCSSGGYGPPPNSVGEMGNHYGGNNHGDCIKFLICVVVILILL